MRRLFPAGLVCFCLVLPCPLACDKKEEKRDDKKAEKKDDEKADLKTDEKSDEKADERIGQGTAKSLDFDDVGGPVTLSSMLLHFAWWNEAPDFCKTPERLLTHLVDVLGSETCSAQYLNTRGREQLILNCTTTAPAGGGTEECEVDYSGLLTIRRDRGSETDYRLMGQGDLTRICRTANNEWRQTEAETTDIQNQRQRTSRLLEELKKCQRH